MLKQQEKNGNVNNSVQTEEFSFCHHVHKHRKSAFSLLWFVPLHTLSQASPHWLNLAGGPLDVLCGQLCKQTAAISPHALDVVGGHACLCSETPPVPPGRGREEGPLELHTHPPCKHTCLNVRHGLSLQGGGISGSPFISSRVFTWCRHLVLPPKAWEIWGGGVLETSSNSLVLKLVSMCSYYTRPHVSETLVSAHESFIFRQLNNNVDNNNTMLA